MTKMITKGIEKLGKPDYKPSIQLPSGGYKAQLIVIRKGMVTSLSISNKVAAELIAVGFGYGN